MSSRKNLKTQDDSCPEIDLPPEEPRPAATESRFKPQEPLRLSETPRARAPSPTMPIAHPAEESQGLAFKTKLGIALAAVIAIGAISPLLRPAAEHPGFPVAISPESAVPTQVYVDGKLARLEDGRVEPPTQAKPTQLLVLREGYRPEKVLIKEDVTSVELTPLRGGFLTVNLPAQTSLKIANGRETWLKSTPLEHLLLPAGSYTATIRNGIGIGEKQLTFQIQDGIETYLAN